MKADISFLSKRALVVVTRGPHAIRGRQNGLKRFPLRLQSHETPFPVHIFPKSCCQDD
jgi:hypothetical protein